MHVNKIPCETPCCMYNICTVNPSTMISYQLKIPRSCAEGNLASRPNVKTEYKNGDSPLDISIRIECSFFLKKKEKKNFRYKKGINGSAVSLCLGHLSY